MRGASCYPAVPVNEASNQRYAVGLDLGGTDLKAARVLADGRLEDFGKRPSRVAESAEAPLEVIADAVNQLTRGRRAGLIGIGLGSPGVIHPETGALMGGTPHIPHWEAFPLRERLAARLGVTPAVANDANLAAFAEHRLGAARGARVSITLTVGTGIGAGIVIDGAIVPGAWGGAGEIGHLPLGRSGMPCRCGVPDCVEPDASGSGIAAHARAAGIDPCEARDVFSAAAAGDPRARTIVEAMVDRLAATIGAAVSLINPEVVVVGGGVSQAGEFLMAPLRVAAARYTLATHRQGLRVVAAALGERAGTVGAGLYAWEVVGTTAGRA